jgi:hypothetical protein
MAKMAKWEIEERQECGNEKRRRDKRVGGWQGRWVGKEGNTSDW